MIRHRPEQLARFAGRADDQSLPVRHQLCLGDDGIALEVFQVGRRHQLIQVLQPQLVLGQNNDVLGVTAAAAQRPQLLHLPVDLLQTGNTQLPPHFLEERNQHIAHHPRVVRRPVVVEGGQVKVLRHDVQLVFVQLRQQVLRQYQAVDVRRLEFQPHLPASGADEADVELRVVRRQHPPVHELQKGRQRLLQGRRVRQHRVGDARQPDDLRRQPPAGFTKVWNVSVIFPFFSTTAPISVMASRVTFRPVVSMSKHTISSSKS